MKVKNTNRYLVCTPNGYKPFTGISKRLKHCFKFELENGETIECSENHPFVVNNMIYNSSDLKIGDLLTTQIGLSKIVKIKDLGNKYCYDLLNVGENHQYWTNNILSHNSFLGSVTTLINGKTIEKFKHLFDDNNPNLKQAYEIQLHKDFPNIKINMYMPPQRNKAYIIGADPSTGSDGDYQALTVWDITNTYKIELVASFYENDVPPKYFAYIIAKIASLYNRAYVAIENNGVSMATLEYLWREFEYDNLVHLGGNPKTSIGIASNADRKFDACLNFKDIFENPMREILIHDGRLIDEMERFEKHSRMGKTPTYYATQGHDDLMMCSIWAMYILKPDLIENYYDVRQFATDKLGHQFPLFITSTENPNTSSYEIEQFINELDQKFKNTSNKYDISMNQLESDINQTQEQLMKAFQMPNGNISHNNQHDDDETFQFAGFKS